jgi:hypothetical protein
MNLDAIEGEFLFSFRHLGRRLLNDSYALLAAAIRTKQAFDQYEQVLCSIVRSDRYVI